MHPIHVRTSFLFNLTSLYLISLAQMTEEIREAEDSARLDARIKRLKQQHLDDLQRLYSAHAAEYHEEVLHRHNSKDETQYLSSGENNTTAIASYEKLGVFVHIKRNLCILNIFSETVS